MKPQTPLASGYRRRDDCLVFMHIPKTAGTTSGVLADVELSRI